MISKFLRLEKDARIFPAYINLNSNQEVLEWQMKS